MTSREKARYPHSVNLFDFCKEALNIKHNFEVRVIDQHVGAILGYNPADCSHWKRGKKNLNSVGTVNAIANHLQVDPSYVADLITGRKDVEESVEEYRGYGSFNLNRAPSDERSLQWRAEVHTIVNELLARADVRSAPVLIPEVLSVLDRVRVEQASEDLGTLLVVSERGEDGTFLIRYRPGEMKPHLRFLIAKEIGRALLDPQEPEDINNARLNIFASILLMPTHLLQQVTLRLSHTADLVEQLSKFFWVGRTVVNSRLQDFLAHGN